MSTREPRTWKQQDGPCEYCGEEGGVLAVQMVDTLKNKSGWWHEECLPPELKAWLRRDDKS